MHAFCLQLCSTTLVPCAPTHPPAHHKTDWRVVVSAPLRLTNQLPVGGSLLVWEQQPGAGRELVGRQTVQVASGATVPIHTGWRGRGCLCLSGIACGIDVCIGLSTRRLGMPQVVHTSVGNCLQLPW